MLTQERMTKIGRDGAMFDAPPPPHLAAQKIWYDRKHALSTDRHHLRSPFVYSHFRMLSTKQRVQSITFSRGPFLSISVSHLCSRCSSPRSIFNGLIDCFA